MTVLERKQLYELEAFKERAKVDKESLNQKIEMARQAGIQRQWEYQQHIDDAVERERRTNRALQNMKQAYHNERQKVLDQKKGFDRRRKLFTKQSLNTQRQMQSQLNTFRERERQQNDALCKITQQRQNGRRELESMRSEMESLQIQLDEANKRGFVGHIWRKIY